MTHSEADNQMLQVLEQRHAFAPTVGNFESNFALRTLRESLLGTLSGLPVRVDYGEDASGTDAVLVLVGTPTDELGQQAGGVLQEAADGLPAYLTGADGRWVIAIAAITYLHESEFDVAAYVETVARIVAGVRGVGALPAETAIVSTVRGLPSWLVGFGEVPGTRLARVDIADGDRIYEDLELRLSATTDGSLAPTPTRKEERSELTMLAEMNLLLSGTPVASGAGACLLTNQRAVGVVFSPVEGQLAIATHPEVAHLWGWVDEDGAGTVLVFTVDRANVTSLQLGKGVTKMLGIPSVDLVGDGWTLGIQPFRVVDAAGCTVKPKRGAIAAAAERFASGR